MRSKCYCSYSLTYLTVNQEQLSFGLLVKQHDIWRLGPALGDSETFYFPFVFWMMDTDNNHYLQPYMIPCYVVSNGAITHFMLWNLGTTQAYSKVLSQRPYPLIFFAWKWMWIGQHQQQLYFCSVSSCRDVAWSRDASHTWRPFRLNYGANQHTSFLAAAKQKSGLMLAFFNEPCLEVVTLSIDTGLKQMSNINILTMERIKLPNAPSSSHQTCCCCCCFI